MPIERSDDVYNLRVWKWSMSPTSRAVVSPRTGRRLVSAQIRTMLGELARRLKLRELGQEFHQSLKPNFSYHPARHRGPRFHGYALARAEFAPPDELDFMPADVRDGLAALVSIRSRSCSAIHEAFTCSGSLHGARSTSKPRCVGVD